MKKFILIFAVLYFVISNAAYANKPKKIDLFFNPETKILQALITHPVKNPDKHHISRVILEINSTRMTSNRLTQQENPQNQTVSFGIPEVKTGDVLSVTAICNRGGSLTEKMTVKDEIKVAEKKDDRVLEERRVVGKMQ